MVLNECVTCAPWWLVVDHLNKVTIVDGVLKV